MSNIKLKSIIRETIEEASAGLKVGSSFKHDDEVVHIISLDPEQDNVEVETRTGVTYESDAASFGLQWKNGKLFKKGIREAQSGAIKIDTNKLTKILNLADKYEMWDNKYTNRYIKWLDTINKLIVQMAKKPEYEFFEDKCYELEQYAWDNSFSLSDFYSQPGKVQRQFKQLDYQMSLLPTCLYEMDYKGLVKEMNKFADVIKNFK